LIGGAFAQVFSGEAALFAAGTFSLKSHFIQLIGAF